MEEGLICVFFALGWADGVEAEVIFLSFQLSFWLFLLSKRFRLFTRGPLLFLPSTG